MAILPPSLPPSLTPLSESMGNSAAKIAPCFCHDSRRRATAAVTSVTDDFVVDSFFFLRSCEFTIACSATCANPATPLSAAITHSPAAATTAFSSCPSFFSGINLHWARRKVGEDRVHVVVSKNPKFLFAGIYDGFNGPDATDYLLSNLFPAVQCELHCLLWEAGSGQLHRQKGSYFEPDHNQVLQALSRALKKTEEAYLEIADRFLVENPELALMGSCILAMVMKGDDAYFMNVGDSRAVLAQKRSKSSESTGGEASDANVDGKAGKPCLVPVQLTFDHNTCVEEEVWRIRKDHPDDASAISNQRVKGKLQITRAFGAGFLKQPKWNEGLLKRFKVDYIGSSPYITCIPSLHHLRLNPTTDAFLILSSDGLYQYFTNEEAIAEVEQFLRAKPEGDPAQHLVEETLSRAARKAGIGFRELLEIPPGDRRRYHDDVSVIVIFREGREWRSGVCE